MRHKKSGNRLSRNRSLRKATIRDLARATLKFKRIKTTKAKAKEARKTVERLITLGKRDTLAARRKAFSILCSHQLVSDLFKTIAVKFKNRQGGYTRIIPLTERRGDHASIVFLELTEWEAPAAVTSKKKSKKKVKAIEENSQKIQTDGTQEVQTKIEKESASDNDVKEAKGGFQPKTKKAKKEKEAKEKNEDKSRKKSLGGLKGIFKRKKK